MKKKTRVLLLSITFISVILLILDITNNIEINRYVKIVSYIIIGIIPFIMSRKTN